MKKLGKVLFVIAILAMVIMPLSAAKTMKVTWQWLLSDPDVTAYRYQLNGEDPANWTVVDGTTASFTATGLDPYADYTLYLQCSYDAENWSETATSTAFAMLVVGTPAEEAPVAAVETVEAPVEEVAAPVVAEVAPIKEEAAPAKEEAKVCSYSFSVLGYGVQGTYADGCFTSESVTKGLLTADDIMGFVAYENAKYGSLLTDNVVITLQNDGFTLAVPAGVDCGEYIDQYQADIVAYVSQLFATPEVVVTAPVKEEVKVGSYSFSVFGYGVQGTYADGCFTSESVTKGLLTADDIMGFVAYENAKYGTFLTDNVVITLQNDGFTLAVPAGVDCGEYIDQYQKDIVEYVNQLFGQTAPAAPVEVAAPVEPAVAPAAPVEASPAVEPAPATETAPVEEAPAAVPEPVSDLKYKDVPVEEEAPAVEKVKYNKFEVATTLKFGAEADVALDTAEKLNNYYATAGLQMDFKNIIKLGSKLGLGLRLDANVLAKPIVGWKDFIASPVDNLKMDKLALQADGSAELMAYLNFKKATLFLGAGAGYDISKDDAEFSKTFTLPVIDKTVSGALYVSGKAGMSLDMGKHAAFNLDLGYKYFLEEELQKVNAGAGISIVF